MSPPRRAEIEAALPLPSLSPSPGDAPDLQQTLPPRSSESTGDFIGLGDRNERGGLVSPPTSGVDAPAGSPRQFGDYELLGEIARGGMGVVYKARQRKLNRIVALKMILGGQLASRDDVQRFYTEAEAAANLEHPGIVPIYEVGEQDGQHFYSMGFVDGQSLAHRLGSGPMPPRDAAELMKQIAEAVAYAHGQGVIHRDLKPANILLSGQDGPHSKEGSQASASGRAPRTPLTPKITDFGLAKRIDGTSDLTNTGQILGTPNYMPPEQAAGKVRDIRETADIYSLGAILYAMLSGRPPFQADSPLDVLVQVLESEPSLPSKHHRGIPRELEWICLRCLEKQPARRYATAKDLADDLDRFLRSETVLARPAGLVQRARRWARKEPALAAHLVGVLAAATISIIKFSIFQNDPRFHLTIIGLLSLWGLASVGCQQLLNRERTADFSRYLWSACDLVFVTCLLNFVHAPRGTLLIGYPLLIAASGLFFRVRLVVFTTCSALIAYPVFLLLQPLEARPAHYPIIFEAVLAILGFIVAYQVQRVRVLSQYYDHRDLP